MCSTEIKNSLPFVLDEYKRNTPDEELINDVKNVAKKINRTSVTIAEYEQYGNFHPCTLQRRFGSWFKIMEICGLEPTRSKLNISEEELFKNLEEIWISLGRQPRYSEVKKPLSKYSAGVYEKRFGTFRKALEQFVAYMSNDSKSDREDNSLCIEKKSCTKIYA